MIYQNGQHDIYFFTVQNSNSNVLFKYDTNGRPYMKFLFEKLHIIFHDSTTNMNEIEKFY